MKALGKKKIFVLCTLVLIILAIGISMLIISHRMSLIPSMSFEDMINYTTKEHDSARITVGIIKDGEVIIRVYGKNGSILPKQEMLYEIGSLTKTFTTSLLSKAIYEGDIDVANSIDHYIELPKRAHYPNVFQLITHTSGYKNYYFAWQMVINRIRGEKNDYYGISTPMLYKTVEKKIISDKDHPFVYSNFGISVVGSVLAELYKKDFASLISEFIVDDLNLMNTYILPDTNKTGYWNWNQEDAYIPSGALVSTIDDMLQYVQLFLSGNLAYLSLTNETLKQVQGTSKAYAHMGIRIDATNMGWMIDQERNIMWHNGATSMFNSYIAFDKEHKIGVVILSNLSPKYRIPATVMGVKLMTDLQN